MFRKTIVIMLFSVCISIFFIEKSYTQELEDRSFLNTSDILQIGQKKSFYITPYLGSSTLVGNFGIEFQYNKFGYNIGLLKSIDEEAIDNILCGGVRYYFKPYQHSWIISIGGGIVLDKLRSDDLFDGTGTVMDKYIGILIGYRWLWWDKLHLNIGAGPNYIIWKKIKEGAKHKYLPMVELVIGYSF